MTARARHSEEGFTLVEVVVAMGILLVLASSVLAILTQAAQTSAVDRKRVAASNLAAREIETVRNAFHRDDYNDTAVGASALAIANAGDVTNPNPLDPAAAAGAPLVLNGTPYTVLRQVAWLPLGSGKSACDGGSAVTYPALAVHVEVTWPLMNGVRPVVTDTVLTPPKNLMNTSSAFAAVRVRDRTGAGSPGRQVTLTGVSGSYVDTTGPDGCAVFSVTGAGTYTAKLNDAGYVGPDGATAPTLSVEVKSGELKPYEMYYDRAAGFVAGLVVQGTAPDGGGYAPPQTRPGITLENANLRPDGLRTYGSAVSSVSTLFPWPEGYAIWLGTCSDSDPARPPSSGVRSIRVGATPAQTDTVSLPLRPLKVNVTNAVLALNLITYSARAVYAGSGSCPGGDTTLSLGGLTKEGSAKVLRTSAPPGIWRVEVFTGALVVSSQLVTLGQGGAQMDVP